MIVLNLRALALNPRKYFKTQIFLRKMQFRIKSAQNGTWGYMHSDCGAFLQISIHKGTRTPERSVATVPIIAAHKSIFTPSVFFPASSHFRVQ